MWPRSGQTTILAYQMKLINDALNHRKHWLKSMAHPAGLEPATF
jgi:hypothetical protein